MEFQKQVFVAFLLSALIITVASADCTCELEEVNSNNSTVLKYKLFALASILIAGGVGVSLPFVGNIFPALRPENDSFFLVKAFASGVILATGFIHILPDAFENLTSPCLKEHPWGDFPFTGFVAMVATIVTLLIETSAAAYQLKVQTEAAAKLVGGDDQDVEKNRGNMDVRMHANHGHVHGLVLPSINDSEVHRYRIVSQVLNYYYFIIIILNFTLVIDSVLNMYFIFKFQVLELGIIVHSVIIGLSLGASKNPETIKPLIVALSFHQFFEGLGLGGCIFQVYIYLCFLLKYSFKYILYL